MKLTVLVPSLFTVGINDSRTILPMELAVLEPFLVTVIVNPNLIFLVGL
jgi:hypothetical protein